MDLHPFVKKKKNKNCHFVHVLIGKKNTFFFLQWDKVGITFLNISVQ